MASHELSLSVKTQMLQKILFKSICIPVMNYITEEDFTGITPNWIEFSTVTDRHLRSVCDAGLPRVASFSGIKNKETSLKRLSMQAIKEYGL